MPDKPDYHALIGAITGREAAGQPWDRKQRHFLLELAAHGARLDETHSGAVGWVWLRCG